MLRLIAALKSSEAPTFLLPYLGAASALFATFFMLISLAAEPGIARDVVAWGMLLSIAAFCGIGMVNLMDMAVVAYFDWVEEKTVPSFLKRTYR